MHYIREVTLAELVKDNLKQIVKMAAEDEQEFVRRLTCQSAKEQAVKTRVLKKELELKERRVKDLDGIIKRLYEDNITGKLSDERFKIFSADYEPVSYTHLDVYKRQVQSMDIEEFIAPSMVLTSMTAARESRSTGTVTFTAPVAGTYHYVVRDASELVCDHTEVLAGTEAVARAGGGD